MVPEPVDLAAASPMGSTTTIYVTEPGAEQEEKDSNEQEQQQQQLECSEDETRDSVSQKPLSKAKPLFGDKENKFTSTLRRLSTVRRKQEQKRKRKAEKRKWRKRNRK